MKKRQSNLEILRILCMIAIIADHFSGQSGVCAANDGSLFANIFYIVITSGSRVACNTFVLIGAWFLCEQKFKSYRPVHIWLTIITYTVPITILCRYVLGIEFGREQLLQAFLPIEMKPLWLASCYIILLITSPFLNTAINNLKEKQLRFLIIAFLIIQCLYTTVTLKRGNFEHELWMFFFIYICAGYIKKYGLKYIEKTKSWQWFLLSLALWGAVTLGRVYSGVKGIPVMQMYFENYRSELSTLPCVLLSFSIFFAFERMDIGSISFINLISGTTLGVYCFHQVPVFFDFLWKVIFRSTKYAGTDKQYIYSLCVIPLTFVLGCVIELIRNFIMVHTVEKPIKVWCDKFDNFLEGEKN